MSHKVGDVWRYFLCSLGAALSDDEGGETLRHSLQWAVRDTWQWWRLPRQSRRVRLPIAARPVEPPAQYIRFGDWDVIEQTDDGNIVVDGLPSAPPPYARARVTPQPDMAAREKWSGAPDA